MLKRQALPDALPKCRSGHPVVYRGWWSRNLTMVSFLFTLFSFPLYALEQSDLRVLRSDASGITFDYTPSLFHRDTLTVSGERFDLLSVDYGEHSSEPGHPQIPQRMVLIALPPGARPSATTLESPYREEDGHRLLPAPTPQDGAFVLKTDRSAYALSGMTPYSPVHLETPGIMQGQTVLPVILYPVAYDPVAGRVRLYQRMRVDIRFNAPVESMRPSTRRGAVLPGNLLNANVAASWGSAPGRTPLSRPVSFGPGDWYKISLTESGIYRISRQNLQTAGVDVSGLDPRTIRLFYGGGRALPQDVDAPRPDLREVAIEVTGEGDGRFDENDEILFYGAALSGWDYLQAPRVYSWYQNPYTDTNVYWLSVGGNTPGKRMARRDGRGSGATTQTDTPVRRHEEREIINPLDSGTEWFWQLFDGAFREEATFQVNTGTVTRNGLATARFRFKSKTRFAHHVQVFINDALIGERQWFGESVVVEILATGNWLRSGVNDIRIVLPRTSASSSQPDHVYFDWFELSYRGPLDASGGNLEFEQDTATGGSTARYAVSGASADARALDITDPFTPARIDTDAGGAFQDSVRTVPSRYRTAARAQWKSPVSIARDTPSDLRNIANGADYIILTHDAFISAAEQLRAHREAYSGLRVLVARLSDVYDEFSWGLFDPTAIRDFLRHAALSWTSGAPPTMALLLGDGNFDYRNHSRVSPGVFAPPYEQGDRCTDDWFVYFDGNGDPLIENDIFPDMAIGRLPAQSPAQADIMARKIIAYEASPEFGPWKNTVILTADDERTPGTSFDEPFHIGDTERLFQRHVPKAFQVEKVYLTEYPLDAAGEKPEARDALIRRINDGALLVNWVGHGAANLWAHERLFNTSRELPAIENGRRLPVFFTATCTAGRFDLVTEEAMAETFLRTPDKGAVGFIGATRLSFPSPNAALNRGFYEAALVQGMAIGEALRLAKIQTVNRENSEKYALFGDPAMRLASPRQTIQFTDIVDTLRVLQTATIRGETPDPTFSGTAFVRALDSTRDVNFITSRGGQIRYQLYGSDMFRGPVSMNQGQFTASFIVPKDITYGGNAGRVAVYATDGQTDASGALDLIPLRGTDTAPLDTLGPEIDALVDGRPVADDDYASASPTLTILLSDPSGINITGEVGHQIIVQTDHDITTRQDVTDRFVYETSSFQQGSLEMQLSGLEPGERLITIRAWDNVNNLSTRLLTLNVVESGDLRITDVMNYPNPFEGPTTFTFELTQDADITVQVYTVAGTLIHAVDGVPGFRGFNQIPWNGLDRDGGRLANGAYLYRLTARSRTPDRKTASVYGKMLVVR